MCRYVTESGCRRKNVFCTSFVCSALLNAIWDCDREQGRLLRSYKKNPGHAEFRIYEMVTRVPAADREDVRPLTLARVFPALEKLDASRIAELLPTLTEEVLEVRRVWKNAEQNAPDLMGHKLDPIPADPS